MDPFDPRVPRVTKAGPFASDRLDSWKEIARYLNRDVRTVQRWEETGGLPVYRHAQGRLQGSPVYAYKSELDDWLRHSPLPPNGREEQPLRVVSPRWRTWQVLWVAVPVLILVAGAIVWRFARSKPPAPALRVVQLTSYSGLERYPTFSPDGKLVAFCWNGEKQDNYDIYVKSLDSGEPLRLTTNPGVDGWPAWSPDGSSIAFARSVRGTGNVEALAVPALGGAERRISGFSVPPQPGTNYFPGLCWTPDGKWLIGPYAADAGAPAALALVSVKTLEVRPLTKPVIESSGDCCPAIAPDGKKLAFLRTAQGQTFNVHVLPLGPDYRPLGKPRQLTSEPSGATNPMWTGDSREVLYIVRRDGARTLWRIPHDGSRPASQIESVGPVGYFWAISPRGDRLAYSDNVVHRHILRVDFGGNMRVSGILSSSAADSNPEVAPDGRRIAFVSNRARGSRIWVSDSDGTKPIDLAPTVSAYPGPARWSPGGDRLVYQCPNQGNDDICIVPAGGGAVRQVTRHPARDMLPSWSRDGKWIYYTSNRSGSFQVWKTPADGTDAGAVQLTQGGGFSPMESPDGTAVYFARELFSAGVWRIPSRGGEESQVGTFRILGCRSQNFAVHPDGIYYISSGNPESWFEVWLYRFSKGKPERIGRIDQTVSEGLSVSPDGRWLLVSASDAQSGDLYMVENFR